MVNKNDYSKEYYRKNKPKICANFKKWHSKPKNKEYMRNYMRNYMRKRNNIKKENFRIK